MYWNCDGDFVGDYFVVLLLVDYFIVGWWYCLSCRNGVDVDVNCVVVVSGLFDGDCDDDYWIVEFCWFNGIVYCVDDGFLMDDVIYCNFGVGGWFIVGVCWLVWVDGVVFILDFGGVVVNFYWCVIFYLFVEKVELLIFLYNGFVCLDG